jgi:hypothetical protein
MITIGYSTRKSNPEFQEYLIKSCGHPKTQVIEKITNGEKNLSQIYNEIISESSNDIVVLCHDDIYFDTKNWGQKLKKLFDKNSNFAILGVAGSTNLPKSGMWWEDRSKMWGIVNHEHESKKWESRYSDSLQNNIKEVILVDGLFTAIDKTKIKKEYDESVPGFHMYDVNFCYRNFLEGVKIGVITNIRVTHKSIGMTNEQWEKNRQLFSEKYSNELPSKIGYLPNEELNIAISNSSNITSKFKSEKLINFSSSNPIGFKIGDGTFIINTQNGPQTSQVGQYYKTSESKIDVIIPSNLDEVRMCELLYPNVLQIYNNTTDNNLDIISDYHNVKKILTINDNLNKKDLIDLLNEFKSYDGIKVKIVSGFSEKGGSTTAFINLTNLLNKNGIDCTFYGPHNWHLDKCKSSLIQYLSVTESDILICHFLDLPSRPPAKKVILSCHEKNLYKVGEKKQFWDTVVFINDEHRNYHNQYNGDFNIIPNLKENLISINKSHLSNTAGIIGSIDENKQTHVSIKRALNDNCEKIYVFGNVTDQIYYENYVKPLIDGIRVIFYGTHKNKQEMYNMIGKVYHSSISEVACLVKDECFLTETEFLGNDATKNEVSKLTNEEVITKWIKLFEL